MAIPFTYVPFVLWLSDKRMRSFSMVKSACSRDTMGYLSGGSATSQAGSRPIRTRGLDNCQRLSVPSRCNSTRMYGPLFSYQRERNRDAHYQREGTEHFQIFRQR